MTDKKRVMIIDDNEDSRFFFRQAVKEISTSYDCLEASNGAHALAQLQMAGALPHFIFLDLSMPGMNGWECLEAFKQDKKLKNIPVIIYTSVNKQEDRARARDLGAAFFLTKIWDTSLLPKDILEAMQQAERNPASVNTDAFR